MAARSTNTMAEGLQRLLSDIAQMKTTMDADLPFLLQIETLIVDKLRDPVRQMQEQGMLPPGQGAQQGVQQGGLPPFSGAAQPQRGLLPGPGAPNADELRRLLNVGNA
jgi:hypothetical protein